MDYKQQFQIITLGTFRVTKYVLLKWKNYFKKLNKNYYCFSKFQSNFKSKVKLFSIIAKIKKNLKIKKLSLIIFKFLKFYTIEAKQSRLNVTKERKKIENI